MCLYPRLIQNKKYTATKKNNGIIPEVKDKRVLVVPIGCGKCIECKKQKSRQWQVRLHEEIRSNTNGKFVTLTFNNESIKNITEKILKEKNITGYDLDNEIATHAIRKFLERWRKKYKKSVRHWLVTELGHNGTENIHLHGIIWTNETKETITKIWKYGYTWIGDNTTGGYVNEKTINYIVKYINKIDEKHKEYNSKILTSAGIGKNYLNRKDSENNKYKKEQTQETYKTRSGIKLNLPIYYRNKLYTDEEREQLWIQKLEKQERWICGEKIDISKNNKEYYKTLEYYRKKNTRLGYGDNKKNWEQKKYEEELRQLNLNKRINNITPTTTKPKEYIPKPTQYKELKNIF